jgi:hypothetical protein
MQEAEAAALASAAELADIRAKATFILNHLQPPVSAVHYLHICQQRGETSSMFMWSRRYQHPKAVAFSVVL